MNLEMLNIKGLSKKIFGKILEFRYVLIIGFIFGGNWQIEKGVY